VRIGDRDFDQLERSGHDRRSSDLELIAQTGISALRYPILWETVASQGLGTEDWGWADERLAKLRDLGVRPIVGLLHHGNGPAGTSLLDPEFPEHFARFAARFAERFAWVDAYVPVNEPLTTARFAGLYGWWYPHGRDIRTMGMILLNELRATVLGMRAIRERNPSALLIQNEDVPTILSTPRLAAQAAYENDRRWLTFDLLFGELTPERPMWRRLVEGGVPKEELEWFLANPMPPDIVGVDHYITSDRFLDEDLARYPARAHSRNDDLEYADIEAVRVTAHPPPGIEAALRAAWSRYGVPIALTEVQMGSTRDEQLRWLSEAWSTSRRLRAEGLDVRAVTAWSLLGAYEWNSLMMRESGFYESGAFDLRGGHPRPTALVEMMSALGRGEAFDHPALDGPGWWTRPERVLFTPANRREPAPDRWTPEAAGCRPLVVLGSGALADAFARICGVRGLAYRQVSRPAALNEAADAPIWAVVDARDSSEREDDPVAALGSRALVIRTEPLKTADVPDVVNHVLDLLIDGERGIWDPDDAIVGSAGPEFEAPVDEPAVTVPSP
jgi:dTDP-4-dehydrorhamnose reductase